MATHQEEQLENTLVAKGLTAPRITPAHIDSIIVAKHFFTAGEGVIGSMICDSVENSEGLQLPPGAADTVEPIRRTTICLLILANGAQMAGINYCPISVENWDPAIARELAEKEARAKLWELEAYVLRQKRCEQEQEQADIAGVLADFKEADCEGCKI